MFPSAAETHFQNLWTAACADFASRIGDRVAAFDRNEGAQQGGRGYAARLGVVLREEFREACAVLRTTLLAVHRDFGEPLDADAEAKLLDWANRAVADRYRGYEGTFTRHLGRIGVGSEYASNLELEFAAQSAGISNFLRTHMWTKRNVPGAAKITPESPVPERDLEVVEGGAASLTRLQSRISRLSVQLRAPAAHGFQQKYEASDGSAQTYSVRGLKSPQQLQDELETLFVWVWSMKDHFKAEFSSRLWNAQEVERYVDSSPNLQFVADIANRSKHSTLTKSRSKEWPELTNVHFVAPQSAIASLQVGAASVHIDVRQPEAVQLRASIQLRSGAVLDAFSVLDGGISDWETGPAARLKESQSS
jgi:hypothetical protein